MNALQSLAAQPWVERVGWMLVHFLWQGTLIAALYAIARKYWGDSRSANARYALACTAMAVMSVAPIMTYRLSAPVQQARANPYVGRVPATSASVPVAIASPAPMSTLEAHTWRDDVMPRLVIAWFAGAIIFWMRLLGGWVIASRVRSMLVRPAPVGWQHKLDELGTYLRVSRPVRLLVSALVQVPTVVGWLRPVVLVPVGALAGLPVEHLEALLAHELAHIRRHDYLVNILQSIVESLLFYHPAVWWISGHIRDERELCCDDAAISLSGDAIGYACALADLDAYRPAPFSPVLAANGGSLRERIGRLLNQPVREQSSLPGAGAVAATILIVVAACGVFGQSQPSLASFEAVSLKPNQLGGGTINENSTMRRVTGQMTTKAVIMEAFHIKSFQVVGGPSWIAESNYDIEAVSKVDLTDKVLGQCLQSLLADRFKLMYHRETKELPAYSLVSAKGGAKLTPHTGPKGNGTSSQSGESGSTMSGTKLSMADFAGFLARKMDRPVIDNTGIAGEFDVKIDWVSDQPGAPAGPSIFTALQEQLGLRLVSAKGPVEILVVDSVEKPSEN